MKIYSTGTFARLEIALLMQPALTVAKAPELNALPQVSATDGYPPKMPPQ